jgi:hypothetical protein
MASAGVTLALSYSSIASGTISTAAAAVVTTGEPVVAASPVTSMKDEVAIVGSQRSWIDFSGRLTDVEGNVVALNEKIDKIETNVIVVNDKIEDLRRDSALVFFMASILFVNRSEVKDEQMRKEMDKNKAEADAKMDKNFITSAISVGSLLVSLVMTLAAKK